MKVSHTLRGCVLAAAAFMFSTALPLAAQYTTQGDAEASCNDCDVNGCIEGYVLFTINHDGNTWGPNEGDACLKLDVCPREGHCHHAAYDSQEEEAMVLRRVAEAVKTNNTHDIESLMGSYGSVTVNKERNALQVYGGCNGTRVVAHHRLTPSQVATITQRVNRMALAR